MATIREIAKRVGFSQATVSRVLKDDPTFSVKDSTREKILNASLEMGYKNVPQYQRITIPQDVAILDNVVPDKGLQDAYFDELREVLVKHAEEQRMNVTMHEDVDSLIADADKYAGFISIGPSPLNHKTLHRLHKKLPHGVFIDINPAPALFDSVQPDLEQTILDAIDALMGSGCSRIGFIGGLGNIMGKHEYPEIFVRSHSAIGRCVWAWTCRDWCMRTARSLWKMAVCRGVSWCRIMLMICPMQ